MQYDKLFQLLARDDVQELALQSDRPPCVRIGDSYTPVMNRNLSEDEVIAALVEAGGRVEVVGLVEGARRWGFEHPTLGGVRVSAGYHGGLLQARLRRGEAAPPGARPEPKRAAERPTVSDKPRAMRPEKHTGRADTFEAPGGAELELASAAEPAQVPGKPAVATPTASQASGARAEPELEVSAHGGPAQLFEALLKLARARKATDLHIVADRQPMLRLGGEMVKVGDKLSAELVEQMLMAAVPAHLREELMRDGSCDFALAHPTLGRFRTNVNRQRTGMKLTARPIGDHVPTLAELGLPEALAGATHHHQGLIVVTGPTGHGKTSTLAAIIDVINSERSDHIITVEDPIEYVHPRKKAVLSQREVGTHTQKFASALKGSLREDPDVIAVGELRDTETVRMALSASETGHLVISTMNTPSAAKAIERLIDLFPPGDQPQVRMSLAGGLRMISSQRLVPSADRKSVKAAVELLPGSPALWALIRDGKTFQIPSLQQRGKALGIIRLDDSLAELVRSGHTTLEIAKEFAEAPEQLEATLRGGPVKAPEAAPANEQTAKFGKDMLSRAGKLFGGEK